MKHIQKWIALLLLLVSIGSALWLYRFEPTAKIDPNDNAFQYALIDRTNTIWDYAASACPKTITYPLCHLSHLIDHWVPNWAEGYNLPNYYSHIPQILIVGSYRMFTALHIIPAATSLFQYYHTTIYLLICMIPLSLFLAFRILKLSWLSAGLASFFALLISTDGLYGIDQASFLWRGWGLSSQLFALLWFPLAVACAIQYVTAQDHKQRNLLLSVVFLTATTTGHLGIGMMAWMAVAVIACSSVVFGLLDKQPVRELKKLGMQAAKQTMAMIVPTFFLLSYWIIPVFTGSEYHNTSVWDPVWKFNSFGVVEVVTQLANGALFDFGRLPLMTILIFVGTAVALAAKKETEEHIQPLGLLFVFFLLLFFGRTTWGGIIDLIPGMSDFHGHRFIVGLHLAGLFLAPIGAMWLVDKSSLILSHAFHTKSPLINIGSYVFIGVLAYFMLMPQIRSYARYNDTLILEGNKTYDEAKNDMDLLMATITKLQTTHAGRVYALRGTEGSNFRIASSSYYMQLSTYGVPTVLWLPETWSPNADTEQFFTEENADHYNLYNIRYVVAPPDKQPQPFWKQLQATSHWTLYEVQTSGYVDVGYAPSVVASKKTDFINLVHLWIQSPAPDSAVFPELQITNNMPATALPHFSMTDPTTYKTPDNKLHSLFAEPPIYTEAAIEPPPMRVLTQTNNYDMLFTATVEVTEPCPTCIILLKQTYHPNWKATINGKTAELIEVFPSYSAVRLQEAGKYSITFFYQPDKTKIPLAAIGIVLIGIGSYIFFQKRGR